MTVYAVLRINNYSLVNIHFTLDAAINQILRLEPRYDILKMHRDLEDNLTHIESQEHIIQPYNIP